MRLPAAAIPFVLFVLSAAGSANAQQAAMELRPGERIAFFGDSITDQGGFLPLIQAAVADETGGAVTLVNRGLNGGMVTHLLEGAAIYGDSQPPFTECLREDRPTVAVVFVGVNDARGGPGPAVYEQGLRSMVRLAQRAGARVVLATPALDGELPRGANGNDAVLDAYAALARTVAEQEGAVLVDLRAATAAALAPAGDAARERSGRLSYDGIHMNAAGNALLARELLAGVRRALEPALVPWPRRAEFTGSWLPLPDTMGVPCRDERGRRPEHRLTDDLRALTGRVMPFQAERKIVEGQWVVRFEIAQDAAAESCTLIATPTGLTLRAPDEAGLFRAAKLFVQSLGRTEAGWFVPLGTIEDAPAFGYRALMLDVARQWHPPESLYPLVELASFYGLRQVQLHLTDDQSFTFPSASFPELGTPDRHYRAIALTALDQRAASMGVTLVPELDLPGHSTAMRRARPDLFDSVDPGTGAMLDLGVIDLGRAETWAAVDTLIGEIAAIFPNSPWIHVGGDEAWLGRIHLSPATAPALAALGSSDPHDLFLLGLRRLHESVMRHGKRTLMWESFRGTGSAKVEIPRDVTVFGWETAYELPQNLLSNGYPVLNASWKPLYVTPGRRFSRAEIFAWNPWRWENWWEAVPSFTPIQLERHPAVGGAMFCSWEMAAADQLDALRPRVPVFAERLWNPDGTRSFGDLLRRAAAADWRFGELSMPVVLDFEGALGVPPAADDFRGTEWFAEHATLHIRSLHPRYRVSYTLDGSQPGPITSPAPAGSIELTASTEVRVRIFGGSQPREVRRRFDLDPVAVEIEGLLTHLPNAQPWLPFDKFGPRLELRFRSRFEGGVVRYTIDGAAPGAGSPLAEQPVILERTATVRARAFDAAGQPRGSVWTRRFEQLDFERNLTTGKPAQASSQATAKHDPAHAVDGVVSLENYWDGSEGGPQWWSVDLEAEHTLRSVRLWTYWDGARFYEYTVELSRDGRAWTEVVDERANTTPVSAAGYAHDFAPTPARYVRVRLLRNSANPGKHLVEVRVYE
ncbi:MAG TPA: family 20 glycosylhydrolase [Planctomycetota bacterium]